MEIVGEVVSKVTSHLSSGLNESTSQEVKAQRELDKQLARALWVKMTGLYGYKWTSVYGTEPDSTWTRGLAGVDKNQLAAGLKACMEREDEWPPGLATFKQYCMLHQPANTGLVEYEDVPPPSEPMREALRIHQVLMKKHRALSFAETWEMALAEAGV